MKERLLLASLLAAAAIPASAASTPTEAPAPVQPLVAARGDSFYDAWIRDRLTIGLSLVYSQLTDNKREPDREGGKTFVGYLNLMEDENEFRVLPEVTYWAADYVRVKLAFEKVMARVYNYDASNPHGPHSSTDGIVKIGGPVLMLEAIYPLCDDTVFPHVGVGAFFGFASLHEDRWWHHGYSSAADHAAHGNTDKTKNGYYREIHVDDAVGLVVSAGVAWRPIDRLQLDLEVRQTWIEPDCEFGYAYSNRWEKHRDGDFTFDNFAVALTASYVF